jgi:hypothetical protein
MGMRGLGLYPDLLDPFRLGLSFGLTKLRQQMFMGDDAFQCFYPTLPFSSLSLPPSLPSSSLSAVLGIESSTLHMLG